MTLICDPKENKAWTCSQIRADKAALVILNHQTPALVPVSGAKCRDPPVCKLLPLDRSAESTLPKGRQKLLRANWSLVCLRTSFLLGDGRNLSRRVHSSPLAMTCQVKAHVPEAMTYRWANAVYPPELHTVNSGQTAGNLPELLF